MRDAVELCYLWNGFPQTPVMLFNIISNLFILKIKISIFFENKCKKYCQLQVFLTMLEDQEKELIKSEPLSESEFQSNQNNGE